MMAQNSWYSLKDWEGFYLIHPLGFVKSIRLNKILIPQQSNCNYYRVGLHGMTEKKHMISIHRLVAINFIDNPENLPCVNHKDGFKWNNGVSNLEWCTHSENTIHAFAIGLKHMGSGELNPYSKLRDIDIPIIRNLSTTKTHSEIAALFNVDRKTISFVINRKTWKHI
jgi:hypothetical protein